MSAVAPAPAPAETVDALVLLELEQELGIPCENRWSGGEQCGRPATHWIVCRQCRGHIAECDPCLERTHAWATTFSVVGCKSCHALVNARHWRDLFDVVPLHLGST